MSVAATDGIDEMLPFICEFMRKCDTSGLSLEESGETSNTVKILQENVKEFQVTFLILSGKDVPNLKLLIA